jgi:hypothetical protein
MRWTGSRIMEKQDCTLFYNCDNKDHILGTGFLVSKRIKHPIIDFKPTTPRICTLRTRGKCFNYSVVKGHAPTETSDEEKDRYFHVLETAFDISPRNNIKIVSMTLMLRWVRNTLIFPHLANIVFKISQTIMDPS